MSDSITDLHPDRPLTTAEAARPGPGEQKDE